MIDAVPMPRRLALTDTRGFTLIELLVVMLITAILAAIALPVFTAQRTKAQDLAAQKTLRTAMTAVTAFQIDNDTFDATEAQMAAVEPTLGQVSSAFDVTGTVDSYTITEGSVSGTKFTLHRYADGHLERTCDVPGRGRCDGAGTW